MQKKESSETTPETKEVVKKDDMPIAVAELESLSGQGFEGACKDSFAIPFLRILQTNSPQCNPDEPSYISASRAGMLYNTVTNLLYGKEVVVIPVHYGREFIEWLPNRGGFVQSHGPDPAICKRVVQVDDKNNSILDNGNILQDVRNHYILVADALSDGPLIMSLSSTGIKHSKKWMTLMGNLLIPNSSKRAPMFAARWKIQTVQNENAEGKWYQFGNKSSTAIAFDGWVTKEQLSAAISARELITSGQVDADWDSTVTKSDDLPF